MFQNCALAQNSGYTWPIERPINMKKYNGYERLIEMIYNQMVLDTQYALGSKEYSTTKTSVTYPTYRYAVIDSGFSREYVITVLRLPSMAKIVITDPERSSFKITFFNGGIAESKESNIDQLDPLYHLGKSGYAAEITYILLLARAQMLHDLAQQ